MKKRLITAIAACALAASMMIGGTFAYLTSTKTVENTFTVGKVEIELTEPNYDEAKKEGKTNNIVPNQEIPKDPTIQNVGNNDAIVFAKVTVPKTTFQLVDNKGSKEETATAHELFTLYKKSDSGESDTEMTTIGANENSGWFLLGTSGTENATEYIYGYKTVLGTGEANKKTTALFDYVKAANFAESSEEALKEGSKLTIPVAAYAIQAEGVSEVTKKDDGTYDDLTQAKLKAIYNIYMTQNGGSTIASSST